MTKKKKFINFNQFDGTDLVALVTVIGGLILMGLHINGIVGGLLTLIAAYYFGVKKNGRDSK